MNEGKPEGQGSGAGDKSPEENQAAVSGQSQPDHIQGAGIAPVGQVPAREKDNDAAAPETSQTDEDSPLKTQGSLRPGGQSPEGRWHIVSKEKQYIKILAGAVIIGFIVWLVPGPGWRSKAPAVDLQSESGETGTMEVKNLNSVSATLFLPDKGMAGLVKQRMTLNVPEETEGAIKTTLEELFNNSQARNAIFPPGMEVLGVYLHEKTAIISLGGGFRKNFRAGVWTEILAVYSIVNTVCGNYSSYGEVRLLINDAEEEVFAAHVDISASLAPDYSMVKEEKKKVAPAKTPSKKSR